MVIYFGIMNGPLIWRAQGAHRSIVFKNFSCGKTDRGFCSYQERFLKKEESEDEYY